MERKLQRQIVSSIGDKTGSPRLYPDNGDKGRGRHIKQSKRLNRRPVK